MTASRVFPPSYLPPESQPWARDQEESALQDLADVGTLETNSLAAYKQLNATAGGVATQLYNTRKYLYSMPAAISGKVVSDPIVLAANTWTVVCQNVLQIPAGPGTVTVLASANINLDLGTTLVNPWFSLWPGSGVTQESVMSVQQVGSGPTIYSATGQASLSATYAILARRGVTMTLNIRLWNATAISPGGSAVLNFDAIYGG